MPLEDHQRTFSFQISHDFTHAVLWRYFQQEVDVIWACFCRDFLHSWLSFYQRIQDCPDILLQLIIDHQSSIFWCEYDTILNHTDLYEYKHGKMLMHLHFCFEGVPTEHTPAAML